VKRMKGNSSTFAELGRGRLVKRDAGRVNVEKGRNHTLLSCNRDKRRSKLL